MDFVFCRAGASSNSSMLETFLISYFLEPLSLLLYYFYTMCTHSPTSISWKLFFNYFLIKTGTSVFTAIVSFLKLKNFYILPRGALNLLSLDFDSALIYDLVLINGGQLGLFSIIYSVKYKILFLLKIIYLFYLKF